MSISSNLLLVANSSVRIPSYDELNSFLEITGVLRPHEVRVPFWNLHDDVTAIFADEEAPAQNDRFFTPVSVSGSQGIEVEGPDEFYKGKGCSISIGGYGYLFLWENDVLAQRILAEPRLEALARQAQATFGGTFVQPKKVPCLWERAYITASHGWAWLRSETF